MSADDLAARRQRRNADVRRTTPSKQTSTKTDGPPAWATRFVIPRDACEACAQHWHHKCWGVNVLLNPIPTARATAGTRKTHRGSAMKRGQTSRSTPQTTSG